MSNDESIAYVCRECGEGFAPVGDWPELRADHRAECVGATFHRTTVEHAF